MKKPFQFALYAAIVIVGVYFVSRQPLVQNTVEDWQAERKGQPDIKIVNGDLQLARYQVAALVERVGTLEKQIADIAKSQPKSATTKVTASKPTPIVASPASYDLPDVVEEKAEKAVPVAVLAPTNPAK